MGGGGGLGAPCLPRDPPSPQLGLGEGFRLLPSLTLASKLLLWTPLSRPQPALSSVHAGSRALGHTPQARQVQDQVGEAGLGRRAGESGVLGSCSRKERGSVEAMDSSTPLGENEEMGAFSIPPTKNSSLHGPSAGPPSACGATKHRFPVCGTQDTASPTLQKRSRLSEMTFPGSYCVRPGVGQLFL